MFRRGDRSQDTGNKKQYNGGENPLTSHKSNVSLSSQDSRNKSSSGSSDNNNNNDSGEKGITRGARTERESISSGSGEKKRNTGGVDNMGGNWDSLQQQQQQQPRQKSKDYRIRKGKGPELLKKTLSSLSLSSGASEEDNISSPQDPNLPHHWYDVKQQHQQQHQPILSRSSSGASDVNSRMHMYGKQAPQSETQPSRKQSLAGSFLKKFSGSGSGSGTSDGESGAKESSSQHGRRFGHPHGGGLHMSFYNNNNNNSIRPSRDTGSGEGDGNDSNDGKDNILKRKVSTFVHGLGHEHEQQLPHLGKRPFHHEKKSNNNNNNNQSTTGSKASSTRADSRKNNAATNDVNGPKLPSRKRRESSPEPTAAMNKSEGGSFFPLDTNLENVSDITKAPEVSRRPSTAAAFEGYHNPNDSRASISVTPSQSVTHLSPESSMLSKTITMNAVPPGGKQQWVAPESWDVASNVGTRRAKKHNKSVLHQEHHQQEGRLQPPPQSRQVLPPSEEEEEQPPPQPQPQLQEQQQQQQRQQQGLGDLADMYGRVPKKGGVIGDLSGVNDDSQNSSLVDYSDSTSDDLDYPSDGENYLGQGAGEKGEDGMDFQKQPPQQQQQEQQRKPVIPSGNTTQSLTEALNQQPPSQTMDNEQQKRLKAGEKGQGIDWNQRMFHDKKPDQQLYGTNLENKSQDFLEYYQLQQQQQRQQQQQQLQQQLHLPPQKEERQHLLEDLPIDLLRRTSTPDRTLAEALGAGTTDHEVTKLSSDDEKHDRVEYELERYYKDFSDLNPKRHYTIRIFNTDDTFTTLSCTPATTVRDILPSLKRKFNITSQGSFQISLKVGKLSKILRPYSKPIIIERKLLLLNGYKKTDPLHIMGIEDLSFLFKFLFHPVAPSHLTPEQEQRLLRSDFIHIDLRGMDLTTPPIIFYQHTSEIESLDVSNNADIFLPLEFIESATKLSSLRMVNIRASKFPMNICDAKKLVSLELQRNFIRKVPQAISRLTNLTILNLQCNELDKIPRGFSQLKNLQLLDLSSNRFVYYPEVVNECSNLLQINLSYNKIHTLPLSINRLVKLVKMNLAHNKLGMLPDLSKMQNLRTLNSQHNRIARIKTGAPNLQNLSLTDNRISTFDDTLPKLKTLELQENPITSISYSGFTPMKMTSLSLSKAKLSSLPDELFRELRSLEKLDLSENNLTKLPDKFCRLDKLIHFSAARNKLQRLPVDFSNLKSLKTLDLHSNNIRDFASGTENLDLTFLNVSSNMFGSSCLMGQFSQNISPNSRLSNSLEFLIAADNQFNDQMWPLLNCFTNLKVLNLSYNDFQDITNLKLEKLQGLYFSGNKLTTVSGDVVLKWKDLKTLMLNGNYLLSLPAEFSQLKELKVFDVGSNQLKYNISNFHYDWNWNQNKELKYLNFSGNRRFEIKSSVVEGMKTDFSDLTVLPKLKVLGLMDVTLNTSKVPDENINFRLRTSGSIINGMRYGVADTLGKREFVSSRDVTFERFGGKDDECLLCLHDGKNQYADYGHNIARLVRNIYDKILLRQLEKCGDSEMGIKKALRLSFLQLNKEINAMLSHVDDGTYVADLTSADLLSGACSTIVYVKGDKIYTANIGDCMAILSKANGDFRELTSLHVPYKREEYERIRVSGGYVNDYKLDGVVDVSRAVGFFDLLPHIHASPDISLVTLTKSDEMLIIATNQLWQYMDFETACDIARENNSEPMLAAEAMKDHAIAYGCSENLTIMCLSLHKDSEQDKRFMLNRNSLITRRNTFEDATLRRLQPEIAPPTGNLAIVFTDIKSSTFLWEMFPNAMRTAIKTHNDIMRRLLRIYGGYEVKTEGDAFMVAFPTPISALIWCMSVQLKFLEAQWPEEITSCMDGCLVVDKAGNKIYQGLSVRMGVHWGCPVPEFDLVTQRMDYLGPMVNKAARVEGVAAGGQITLSSDFISEFKKIMRFHEIVVKEKRPLKEVYGEQFVGEILEKEISMLESIGWVFFDHGEQKLKGLETKEAITIAYPKSLVSRHNFITKDEEERLLNEEFISRLRAVARRVESILSAVNKGTVDEHRKPGRLSSIDENVRSHVRFLNSEGDATAFFDDLITRLESYIAILKLHQVVRKGLKLEINNKGKSLPGSNVFDILDAALEKMQDK